MFNKRKNNNDSHHVYAIVGDGEMQEGQIWEAAMNSNKYELDKDNKHIKLEFNLEKLKYSVLYEFTNVNNSIRVINYSFVD